MNATGKKHPIPSDHSNWSLGIVANRLVPSLGAVKHFRFSQPLCWTAVLRSSPKAMCEDQKQWQGISFVGGVDWRVVCWYLRSGKSGSDDACKVSNLNWWMSRDIIRHRSQSSQHVSDRAPSRGDFEITSRFQGFVLRGRNLRPLNVCKRQTPAAWMPGFCRYSQHEHFNPRCLRAPFLIHEF